jgi:(2Fe-2S) ferredoxin
VSEIEAFRHHVFVCTNKRDGRPACEDHGAKDALAFAKEAVKTLPAADRSGVRLSQSGCLGRCDHGPVAVVYPARKWIGYGSKEELARFVVEAIAAKEPVAED